MPIFELIFKELFQSTIEMLIDFFNKFLRVMGIVNIFSVENLLGIPKSTIVGIQGIALSFTFVLLSCKLSYKLFNIYVLGIDGDNTTSPFEYLKGYVKGLVVCLCFTVVYGWLGDVCIDIAEQLENVIGKQEWGQYWTKTTTEMNVIIFVIIYCAICLYFCITFIITGVRMLFLRLAIPFTCVGLIDNDNGIYSIFIKKLFQTSITAIAQFAIINLSVIPMKVGYEIEGVELPMLGDTGITFIGFVMSIAIMVYGIKLTSDLNEIFSASPTTGAGQKLSAIGSGIKNAISFIK